MSPWSRVTAWFSFSGEFEAENREWGVAEALGGGSFGIHVPLKPDDPFGIHLEAGVLSGRMAGFSERTEALSEVFRELADIDESELTEFNAESGRYWFIPFSAGLSFEDNCGKIGVFARLSLTTSINGGGGRVTEDNGLLFRAKPANLTSGHSAEFGLIFSERLRMSVAWHDPGEIAYEYDSPAPPPTGPSDTLTEARHIRSGLAHSFRVRFFELRMGYTLGAGRK